MQSRLHASFPKNQKDLTKRSKLWYAQWLWLLGRLTFLGFLLVLLVFEGQSGHFVASQKNNRFQEEADLLKQKGIEKNKVGFLMLGLLPLSKQQEEPVLISSEHKHQYAIERVALPSDKVIFYRVDFLENENDKFLQN